MNYLENNDFISEEELLNTKKIEDKSKYFHSFDKGCKLVDKELLIRSKNNLIRSIKAKHCKTHDVMVCRCGWEFGYHYNKKADINPWNTNFNL